MCSKNDKKSSSSTSSAPGPSLDYDPTSEQYGAETTRNRRKRRRRGRRRGHHQATLRAGLSKHVCVFLEWGAVVTPNTVSQLLLRSGDVERNPGPRPGDEDVCGDCGVQFTHASRPVQCGECSQRFCRTAKPGVKVTCVGRGVKCKAWRGGAGIGHE